MLKMTDEIDIKLAEIYSRYEFVEIQDTEDDGIIMVK